MADRLENVEQVVEDGKTDQIVILQMIMKKLEEIQEHQKTAQYCQSCSSRFSAKSSDDF